MALKKSYLISLYQVKKFFVYQARALLQSITYVGKVYADSCDNAKVRKEMWLDDEPTSVSVADGVQAKLFPNPNNGTMILDYDLGNYSNAKVNLFDITGKIINSYKLSDTKGILQMNEQDLNNGIYFYSILVGDKTIKTDKIVIIK